MKEKVTLAQLEQCVSQGLGVTAIAKRLNCSKGAVSRRLKRLKISVAKDVSFRHAGEVVERRLDHVDQIKKINTYCNELLDLLMRWNRGDDEALQILEGQIVERKVRVGKDIQFVKEYRMKDPRELALMAMREIRGQIQLQFDIVQGLIDFQATAEFQKEVIDAIGSCSSEVRERIVQKLKEKGTIQWAFELP